jgi:hypothetical protein
MPVDPPHSNDATAIGPTPRFPGENGEGRQTAIFCAWGFGGLRHFCPTRRIPGENARERRNATSARTKVAASIIFVGPHVFPGEMGEAIKTISCARFHLIASLIFSPRPPAGRTPDRVAFAPPSFQPMGSRCYVGRAESFALSRRERVQSGSD